MYKYPIAYINKGLYDSDIQVLRNLSNWVFSFGDENVTEVCKNNAYTDITETGKNIRFGT